MKKRNIAQRNTASRTNGLRYFVYQTTGSNSWVALGAFTKRDEAISIIAERIKGGAELADFQVVEGNVLSLGLTLTTDTRQALATSVAPNMPAGGVRRGARSKGANGTAVRAQA